MLVGQSPFNPEELKPVQVYANIVSEEVKYPEWLEADVQVLLRHLLLKNPRERLGSKPDGALAVMSQAWFKTVEWERMARREIKPPMVPIVQGSGDTRNFDLYEEHDPDESVDLTDLDMSVFSKTLSRHWLANIRC